MEKFSIQRCVIDSLKASGYRFIIVHPEGVFFYFSIGSQDMKPLPKPNENGFYRLNFDSCYNLYSHECSDK